MDERIVKALHIIEAEIGENRQLGDIASKVHVSPYHFHRLFKKETGLPLKQFIEKLKIEKSYELLLNSNQSVRELSGQLGYNDYETFSRAFKKRFKVSPHDLKAIVTEALKNIQQPMDGNTVVVIPADSLNEQLLAEKIGEQFRKINHTAESGTEQVFMVTGKTDTAPHKNSITIKNKYSMKNTTTLWEKVLANLKTTPMLILLLCVFAVADAFGQSSEDGKALQKILLQKNYKSIPMRRLPSGHLALEVRVNGVNGQFILDSGAGGSVLEEKRVVKFKVKAEKSDEQAAGAGGSGISTQLSAGNHLELNGYSNKKQSLVVMTLEDVNSAFRQMGIPEIDGILGADVLQTGNAIIDYSNLLLYLK